METVEEISAYESVAGFYAGKSVLVTGFTGFLGKVFLEKLLYSCKDIGDVYVLIRAKKSKDIKQRLEETINKPLFERLKEERPNDLNKVIPIAGDINLIDLGISAKDEEILIQNVSVVFHIAATIRFTEELKDAVNANVTGTKYVLQLCQRMKNIKAFVHVSTAYSNPEKHILEEKMYPPPAKLSEVQTFLDQSISDSNQIKTLLKGAPNTYTFTKALAENYVAENYGNIPTVIIRPSIVSASLREPLAGWVDNWSGANGILAGIMLGGIKVMLGHGDNVLDLIPVDYVANLIIVAAARCRRYVEIQSKIVAGRDVVEFFTTNSWEMKADHTRALHASLSAEDRHQFPFDPSDINWDEYMPVYTDGIKRFLLKKRV